MQKSEYRNIFENEENHFYYRAINGLVLDIIKREGVKSDARILDAGCGTGGLLKLLSNFEAEGVDISLEALKFCKLRVAKAKQGSLEKLPFRDKSFEAVISIDVIYHKYVKDDFQVMKELSRVLKPNGLLILRAPAFKHLTSDHDEVVMTRWRYTSKELKNLAQRTGFQIKQVSYLNLSLFLGSLLSRGGRGSSVKRVHPVVNAIGLMVLNFENWLVVKMKMTLPFGQGVLLVAEKRGFFVNS